VFETTLAVAIALNRFGDVVCSGDGGDRRGALRMVRLAIASLLNRPSL
jgi:hypothetical protein